MSAGGESSISFQSAIEGDAGIEFDGSDTFTDILLPKVTPPKIHLLEAVLRRRLAAIFRL
jgi:hypothetical protein